MYKDLLIRLREETKMGILACKEALEKANGNYEHAKEILKEGVNVTESKRVPSKGSTFITIHENEAILFEVNGETDFLAKQELFMKLLVDLGNTLIHTQARSVAQALKETIDSVDVATYIKHVGAQLKENIFLRRFYRVNKENDQSFGTYFHPGGRVSVLVIFDKKTDTLGREIAMHIASHEPKYVSYSSLDQESINYEQMLYTQDVSHQKNTFLSFVKNQCLYDQPYLKQPEKSVFEILDGINVIDFFRLELGQGIENKLNCKLDLA